jgi:GNAT superfamily N-acetyltransferase
MKIKSITEIDDKQQKQSFELFKQYKKSSNIKNFDEYISHCKTSHFNYGKEYFVLIDDNVVKSTIGLITKPIEENGDAYLTDITCIEEEKHYLELLLKHIKNKGKSLPPHTLKAGYSIEDKHIEEILLKNGGVNPYEIIEMNYDRSIELEKIHIDDKVEFIPLSKKISSDYIFVHNESFKNSPNGSIIEEEDMKEVYDNYIKYPYYEISILQENNNLIGFYEILIDNGVGEVDSIGVVPEYQGKGYGLKILKKAVEVLKKQSVDEIKLIVVSTNENAYNMYKKYGFKVKNIYSKWYELAY